MPSNTEHSILVETLSRYISNYPHAIIDVDDLADVIGSKRLARRVVILADMVPTQENSPIWLRGNADARYLADLSDDPVVAAVASDWGEAIND